MAVDRAAPGTGRSAARRQAGFVPPAVTVWLLLVCAALIGYLALGREKLALMLSTDDAMRLVQVRDLMAGQGWFDLMQHRLGPSLAGTEMHWSRLVDAPIAALILALRPVLGPEGAEEAAVVAWPLLLILPLLCCAAWVGRHFAGRPGAWIACLIMAASVPHIEKFKIGALDHHNVQIAVLVVAATLVLRAFSSLGAAAALGIALAVCLAIGAETLPHVAVLSAVVAVHWVIAGPAARPYAAMVAGAFCVALGALFVGTAPGHAWDGGYCDGLTRDVTLPFAVAGTLLVAAAATLSGTSRRVRAMAVLATAAATLASAALLAPACLSDPLASIDPFLRANWLDRVAEAKPLAGEILRSPDYVIPVLLATAVAMTVSVREALRGPGRTFWLAVAALVAVSLAVSLWQVRGLPLLLAMSALPNGVLLSRLWLDYRSSQRRAAALALAAVLALTLPGAASTAVSAAASGNGAAGAAAGPAEKATFLDCVGDGQMAAVAALPPGLVSSSSNLGPYVLLNTRHRVLSAPYHRNVDGMALQLRIALAGEPEAEERLREAGVDYVLACPTDAEYARFDDGALARRLTAGDIPPYLERLALEHTGTGAGPSLLVFRLGQDG